MPPFEALIFEIRMVPACVQVRGVQRPYFAMELVEGVPVTEHIRAHSLSIKQRLGLMARVCDAVQYAHQKGIIHRDLKPGNVLVDGTGNPRIIDFGVAGELHAQSLTTMLTSPGELLGTLVYMSPEQLSAAGVPDTRTDVYALGVIAYEALSESMPFRINSSNLIESIRLIERHTPEPLGRRDRRLRGDIETVVAKAMARDRTHRYAAASELGSDLRRCVTRKPIQARPPSFVYHARMFARRNRALVAGFFGVLLATALGVSGIAWQWRQTHLQIRMRDQAYRLLLDSPVEAGVSTLESERRDLHELAGWLISNTDTAPDQTIWIADRVARLLDAHADYQLAAGLNELAMELCDDAPRQGTGMSIRFAEQYAESLRRAGDPWRSVHVARATRERHSPAGPVPLTDSPISTESTAHCIRIDKLRLVAVRSLHDLGRLDEAERLLRELLARFEITEADSPLDEQWDVIATKVALARILVDRGPESAREALDLMRELSGVYEARMPPRIIEVSGEIASLRVVMGEARLRLDEPAEAEALFRAALSARRRAARADHPRVLLITNAIGRSLLAQGRADEAEVFLRAAADGLDREQPGHWHRWVCRADLGRCLLELGRGEEAGEELGSACAGLSVFDEGHFRRVEAERSLGRVRGP